MCRLTALTPGAGMADSTQTALNSPHTDERPGHEQQTQAGKSNWRQARPPKAIPTSQISELSLEQQAAMLAGNASSGPGRMAGVSAAFACGVLERFLAEAQQRSMCVLALRPRCCFCSTGNDCYAVLLCEVLGHALCLSAMF